MKNARSPFLLALLGLLPALSTNAQFGPAIQVATDVDNDVHAKIEAIDMDGDGDLDLIFLSNADLVWVNNMDGVGNFGTPQTLASDITHFGAGDLDDDGDMDVVFADPIGQLSWVANLDGLGSFGPIQAIGAVGGSVETLICTDLNGDGLPDVALSTNTVDGATLRVLINAGGVLSFAATFPYGIAGPGLRMVPGDIDTDGATDLVCLDGDSMLYVLRNATGDALSWSAVEMGQTLPDSRLQLIDVDDDEDLDLILSNWGLLQWGENISSPSNVVPFTRYDVGGDGQANHFGYAFRFGCGSKLTIVHRQGLSGFLYWTVFDQQELAFVSPDRSFVLSSNNTSPRTSTADLNGDGTQDLLNIAFGPTPTLSWYANQFPEDQEPTSIELTPFQALCELSAPFILPQPLSAFGYWTGLGVNGGEFDPGITGPGTFLLTYRVAAPCPISAQAEIVVSGVSTGIIEFLPFDTLCVSGNAYSLAGFAEPANGTWSGPGVENNQFTPPNVGSFLLTYEVAGEECSLAESELVVIGQPEIALVSGNSSDLCGTDALVYEASPQGGTWSGIAQAGGVVERSCEARPGQGSVVYTFNDASGSSCSSSAGFFTLSPCANVNLGPDTVLCSNASTLVLSVGGGTVIGSLFGMDSTSQIGPGVIGFFSPEKEPGVYTIIGAASGAMVCSNADTLLVTIVEPPQVNTGIYGPLCSTAAPISLVGTPANGVWTGEGVNGNQFNPASAGTGSWTLTYTVTESSCTNSDSTTILVDAAPNAGTGVSLNVCSDQAPILLFNVLLGTPQAGGTWSGPSPTNGVYVPSTMAPGTYTYTVSGNGACADASAAVVISEYLATSAGGNNSLSLCSDSAPVIMRVFLTGSPDPNGTWSGPSATSGSFDPASMAQGLYTYTVSGNVACPGASAILSIVVITAPNAGIGGSVELCMDAFPVSLFSQLGGTPQSSGTWTGPGGISSEVFIPNVSQEGIYTYTVSGSLPCGNSSAQLVVNVFELQLDAIDGPTVIDEVEPLTFTALPFLADADSFSWSIPAGWEWITGDSTSATAVLLPPEPFANTTICVTAFGGNCSGTQVCLLSVGISSTPNIGAWFSVHPNPSDGMFQITPQGTSGESTEIRVFDALGHVIAGPFVISDQQPYTLRLEHQSSGIYFMRAVRGGGVKVVELVIQR